jgi:hypothetical protein
VNATITLKMCANIFYQIKKGVFWRVVERYCCACLATSLCLLCVDRGNPLYNPEKGNIQMLLSHLHNGTRIHSGSLLPKSNFGNEPEWRPFTLASEGLFSKHQ